MQLQVPDCNWETSVLLKMVHLMFFFLNLGSNVSTLAFKKYKSSGSIENRMEREGQLEDCCRKKMTKAGVSGSGKSEA